MTSLAEVQVSESASLKMQVHVCSQTLLDSFALHSTQLRESCTFRLWRHVKKNCAYHRNSITKKLWFWNRHFSKPRYTLKPVIVPCLLPSTNSEFAVLLRSEWHKFIFTNDFYHFLKMKILSLFNKPVVIKPSLKSNVPLFKPEWTCEWDFRASAERKIWFSFHFSHKAVIHFRGHMDYFMVIFSVWQRRSLWTHFMGRAL